MQMLVPAVCTSLAQPSLHMHTACINLCLWKALCCERPVATAHPLVYDAAALERARLAAPLTPASNIVAD